MSLVNTLSKAVILNKALGISRLCFFNQMRCVGTKNNILFQDQTDTSNSNFSFQKEVKDDEQEVKTRILRTALQFVPDHGWTKESLSLAADSEGLPAVAHGLFPRGGIELVHFFYHDCNTRLQLQMERQLQEVKSGERPKKKVNVFVRDSVVTRLKMVSPHVKTWPQAIGMMALPQNTSESLSLLTELMDDIWFYAGDKSVDMNWYTKRISLAAVYKSTELFMLQDSSEHFEESWRFLDRRLNDVVSFGMMRKKVENAGTDWSNIIGGTVTTARNMMGINNTDR